MNRCDRYNTATRPTPRPDINPGPMPTGWRKVDERTHAYRDCVALYTRTDNGTIETESHDTYDAHRALADMHLWIARGGKF